MSPRVTPPNELDVDVVDSGAGGRPVEACWLVETAEGRAADAGGGLVNDGEVTSEMRRESISSSGAGDAVEDAGDRLRAEGMEEVCKLRGATKKR